MADRPPPVGTPYEGPSGLFKDSIWLTAENLVEGKDAVVTIEDVLHYKTVTFEGGREKHNMGGLKFAGRDRVLLLNATNRKVLNKAFGINTKLWKGEKVTLYVADAQFAGETVKAVRIRNQRSRVATAAEDYLSGEDEPVAGVGGAAGGAPAPVGAEPAHQTDEAVFRDFRTLAERVTASFGGERVFVKEAPKKSGSYWTCDAGLGDTEQLWIGGENRLAVSRPRLTELAVKLEAMLA